MRRTLIRNVLSRPVFFLTCLVVGLTASGVRAESTTPSRTVSRSTQVSAKPIPGGKVELDRTLPAQDWHSRFCKRWSDGCSECFRQDPVTGNHCNFFAGHETCTRTQVRCHEYDDQVAPLFCAYLDERCFPAAYGWQDGRLQRVSTYACGKRPPGGPEERDYSCRTWKAEYRSAATAAILERHAVLLLRNVDATETDSSSS
jgi:hypothetical protein